MKTWIEAYRERLQRNQKDLLELVDDLIEENPNVEIYYYDSTHKYIKGITVFLGEKINSIHFHEVPYRWSGCGYSQFGEAHYGLENVKMPFTAKEVLETLEPVTKEKYRQPNDYFKSKEQYLKVYSFLKKHNPKTEKND